MYRVYSGGYTYVQCAQLCVRILVAYASFEGAHSLLGIDGLRSNDIGNLEVEGNIFSTGKSVYATARNGRGRSYKLSFVASWTCSSICGVDANHPAIISEACVTDTTADGECACRQRTDGIGDRNISADELLMADFEC